MQLHRERERQRDDWMGFNGGGKGLCRIARFPRTRTIRGIIMDN